MADGIMASRRIQRFQNGGVDDGGGIYGLWKEHVPMTIRLPLQTFFGDRDKLFTEDAFTREELGEFEVPIQRGQERNRIEWEGEIYRAAGRERAAKWAEIAREELTGSIPVLTEAAKNDPEWIEYSGAEGTRKEKLQASLTDRYKSSLPNQPSWLLQDIMGKSPEEIKKKLNDRRDDISGPPLTSGQITGMTDEDLYERAALADARAATARTNLANIQTRGTVIYPDYEDPRALFGAHTTLGKFNWEMKPSGERNITDTYDFYNKETAPMVESYAAMSPLRRLLTVIGFELASLPFIGVGAKPGAQIGAAYIGRDGRDIDITYDPDAVQKKEGGGITASRRIQKFQTGGGVDLGRSSRDDIPLSPPDRRAWQLAREQD